VIGISGHRALAQVHRQVCVLGLMPIIAHIFTYIYRHNYNYKNTPIT
jgi:hypothetical protein